MKLKHIILAAPAFVAFASAQNVNYNFDQAADFSKFKLYKWVEIPGGVKLDDITAKQLTSALESQLALKGLEKTKSDSADLYIGYQVATSQEKQLTAYNTGWGYGPRWGGAGTTNISTETLTIGSLDLDMYDSSQKQLVWRGIASKTLDPGAKPEKRQKNIQKAAEKLLKNYPPKNK
jgi:hypothetical protein